LSEPEVFKQSGILFVIGEETLSRTSIFSLRQSAARFANTTSFIFQSSLMGNIGSHVNITSGWLGTSSE
jgi:hypothetical protein